MNHTFCSHFPVFIDMSNFSKHSAQNSILSLVCHYEKKNENQKAADYKKMYLQRCNQL